MAETPEQRAARYQRAKDEEELVHALCEAGTFIELRSAMKVLADTKSIGEEQGHILADEVLVRALRLLGADEPALGEFVEDYERVFKWYA